MDTLRIYAEYALRALQTLNWNDYQTIFMVCLFVALICVLFYYHSEHHKERVVTNRRRKKQWKKDKVRGMEAITEALEEEVRKGQIKQENVERLYQMLYDAGLRNVGFAPWLGRRWFRSLQFNPYAVKDRVRERLYRMGVDVKAGLEKLKQRRIKAPTKKELVLAELRKK